MDPKRNQQINNTMEKLTVYKTKDGSTFESETDALYHEILIKLREGLKDICYYQTYEIQEDGTEQVNLEEFIVENRYALYETLKEFYDRVKSLNSEPGGK